MAKALILLGFPEWRWPRYCQAILSQLRDEQGVVALDEAHVMYLISTVRKPAGRAVTPGGFCRVAVFRRQPAKSNKAQPCCLVGLQGGLSGRLRWQPKA
jgi:hypothetical protein